MINSIAHHNETVSMSMEAASMPVNVTLKNVPEDLYRLLKRSADAHQRSINGEVIACLSTALRPATGITPELLEDIRRFRESLGPINVKPSVIRTSIKKGRL